MFPVEATYLTRMNGDVHQEQLDFIAKPPATPFLTLNRTHAYGGKDILIFSILGNFEEETKPNLWTIG